jgi:hypothetical protein
MNKRFKKFYIYYFIVLLNVIVPVIEGFWRGFDSTGYIMIGSVGHWVINILTMI